MKTCTKCGLEKVESAFGKNKNTKDGLSHQCRACASRASSIFKENESLHTKGLRRCTGCGAVKHERNFYPCHKGRFGLESKCKKCVQARCKKWSDRNRRRIEAHQKAKRERYSSADAVPRQFGMADQTKAKRMVAEARKRSRLRKMNCSISYHDLLPLPEICPVFGTPLKIGSDKPTEWMSLDRIDPSLGYVPGNVQIISYRANTLKNDATIEELELVLAHMKRHEAARREATNNLTTSAPLGSIDSGAHLTERTHNE